MIEAEEIFGATNWFRARGEEISGFESHFVDCGEVTLHAVAGGQGPAVLLVGGWPQFWYSWRHVMPALAQHFRVVAVDARGVGASSVPAGGYDTATQAGDLHTLMRALGHSTFQVVAHDVGNWIAYAMAADIPGRVERLALVDATIPGVSPPPPLIGPAALNDRLWHFAFNRTAVAPELVRGREAGYFGQQLRSKAGRPDALPDHVVDLYVRALQRPAHLRASFAVYASLDETMAQNSRRRSQPLTIPVLAVGGAQGTGGGTERDARVIARDVQAVVIEDSGHFVAEEQPERLLEHLLPFLSGGTR